MNKFSRSILCSLIFIVSPLVNAQQTPKVEVLSTDTPTTTVLGNRFTAPADWSISVRGPATFIEAPEGGSRIVLVDVEANDGDAALAAAWAAYKDSKWPLKVTNASPDEDGWSRQRRFEYQTSPNERRTVIAGVKFAGDLWTVWIYDMADEIGGKRGAQVSLIFSSLLPKGYLRETFAGRKPNRLDAARIAELSRYIEDGQKTTGVPGVSIGIIQDGKVVFAGGFGVRELGKPEKVDADTLYIIASNTKALTTLLLARLVDAGKLSWQTPVTSLLPSFRLGDDDTTSRVLVEHLICACTGLPRKDLELIFQFDGLMAVDALEAVADIQPTSDFGEMFQYSNGLAAAAGYVAGHVMHPEHEMGAAYDIAMQTEVFDPLGMTETTFDYEHALSGDYASAHGANIDGDPALVDFGINYAVLHVRPAGAAWSNVNDMLRYIAMELAEGSLPDGEQYVSSKTLLERRAAKVPLSEDAYYGMGLMVDQTYGVPVVHHGGDVFGHHSDMMWLPEHGVGAVVLTNGDPGWLIRGGFQRKLLEVLFDGEAQADASLASSSERFFTQLAAERELLDVPADEEKTGELAAQYISYELGEISVNRAGTKTTFDFGEWKSEIASRANPDGSVSFITIDPGVTGFEFVVGSGEERTLIMRDAQHEYVFDEM